MGKLKLQCNPNLNEFRGDYNMFFFSALLLLFGGEEVGGGGCTAMVMSMTLKSMTSVFISILMLCTLNDLC